LFELIGSRYERRSMLITANRPFGAWSKVFPDQAMTLAAIDRLVHHATILEIITFDCCRIGAPQQQKTGTNSDNLSWNDESQELAEAVAM
jgi:DNA replication protein DnaC